MNTDERLKEAAEDFCLKNRVAIYIEEHVYDIKAAFLAGAAYHAERIREYEEALDQLSIMGLHTARDVLEKWRAK